MTKLSVFQKGKVRMPLTGVLKIILLVLFIHSNVFSSEFNYVSSINKTDSFPLVADGKAASLCVSSKDYKGVLRVLNHLQNDIHKVTGVKPEIEIDKVEGNNVVIIGTIGKNAIIDQLISENKIDASMIIDKWDTFALQTVKDPLPGIEKALVIFGSNKRGSIYGMYDLSTQIGVSPWYWWADVPIKKQTEVFITDGFYSPGEPKVKYRGVFINDESPALRNWAKEKFNGINHKMYDKVFELILRLRGNYLWPAMWIPTAFNDDDPENPKLADEYGIVMSTSHHEPMMRAHDEWFRYGKGDWNYSTNKEVLQDFWRKGIERNGDYESVITVGMRGNGDEALSEDTAVDLLKTIISDQRKILTEVTGKPAEKIPQVWALYKEVQDYYDKGMRVDDDILVLFSDDNWGNIRYLPKEDLEREGGYGMYYHFDYVGAPISYRWLNVTQIERVWEQLKLTYEAGVKNLWIVNVGDIKPMEFPISFFFDYAWNPDSIKASDLERYYINWATQQFGEKYSKQIAELLALYTKYNSRRTPEMLSPKTYSVGNYREADKIVEEFSSLFEKSSKIYNSLPASSKSAYYQLVHFPIEACENLNEMYVAAGKSIFYSERGYSAANYYADKAKKLFYKDAEITERFHSMEDGKWNHMMSQTHIGYTYWNHPPLNRMPEVAYVQSKEKAELGYLIEYGKRPDWGWLDVEADWAFSESMPLFDPINDQNYFIDILNRGEEEFEYNIKSENDWILLSSHKGKVKYGEKVYVTIDWSKAPLGYSTGKIILSGTGEHYTIKVPIRNENFMAYGFIENNGIVSIDADKFEKSIKADDAEWTIVPNLGRTGSSVTITPSNAERRKVIEKSAYLEYNFTIFDSSDFVISTYVSPTQDYKKNDGLKFAITIDDEKPQVVNINEGEEVPDWKYAEWWTKSVGDNIKIIQSAHGKLTKGVHKLKVCMIDPGVVLQKIVIDTGGLKPSYLGPPPSKYIPKEND